MWGGVQREGTITISWYGEIALEDTWQMSLFLEAFSPFRKSAWGILMNIKKQACVQVRVVWGGKRDRCSSEVRKQGWAMRKDKRSSHGFFSICPNSKLLSQHPHKALAITAFKTLLGGTEHIEGQLSCRGRSLWPFRDIREQKAASMLATDVSSSGTLQCLVSCRAGLRFPEAF